MAAIIGPSFDCDQIWTFQPMGQVPKYDDGGAGHPYQHALIHFHQLMAVANGPGEENGS